MWCCWYGPVGNRVWSPLFRYYLDALDWLYAMVPEDELEYEMTDENTGK
jgi:hypothetical protein